MVLKKPTEVEIFTSTHWIHGTISPGAQGLFSHLNMPTESSLEVEAGEMSALHQVGQKSEPFSTLWLVKREVLGVLVGNRAGLGPSSVVRAGYTKPFPHWVRILIEGFELIGQIQSGGRFDFRAVIFEGDNPFVPLYDARVSALLFPRVMADAPALAFNRKRVQGISVIGGAEP
ncbi:MAG: hypothetical protein ACK2T2_09940 [Anaerolineales bacterium]|jgi:hypothetical protein